MVCRVLLPTSTAIEVVAVTAKSIAEISGPKTEREFPKAVTKKKLASDKFRNVSITTRIYLLSALHKSVTVEIINTSYAKLNFAYHQPNYEKAFLYAVYPK